MYSGMGISDSVEHARQHGIHGAGFVISQGSGLLARQRQGDQHVEAFLLLRAILCFGPQGADGGATLPMLTPRQRSSFCRAAVIAAGVAFFQS